MNANAQALRRWLLAVALLTACGVAPVSACRIPDPGFGWGFEELLERSRPVVLARYEPDPDASSYMRRLRVVELLRGVAGEFVEFPGYAGAGHRPNDFDAHTARDFWDKDVGRSPYVCCICGPEHTFAAGHTYLLFVDAPGAAKSAEIVRVPDDAWLDFVRRRIAGR